MSASFKFNSSFAGLYPVVLLQIQFYTLPLYQLVFMAAIFLIEKAKKRRRRRVERDKKVKRSKTLVERENGGAKEN